MAKFLVEREPDYFETVNAFTINFMDGDLVLTEASGKLVVGYARGQWVTVVLDEDN